MGYMTMSPVHDPLVHSTPIITDNLGYEVIERILRFLLLTVQRPYEAMADSQSSSAVKNVPHQFPTLK
jgi:hypothetical protein